MLEYLQIENFKTWEKANLKLAPITGLFGANSSGKTSFIQFLLMLKQTKDNVDRSLDLNFGGDNSLVDLGHFNNAVHNHDESKEISWCMRWKLEKKLIISDPEKGRSSEMFSGNELTVRSSVKQRLGGPHTSWLAYSFDNWQFKLSPEPKSDTDFSLNATRSENGGTSSFAFKRTQGRVWALPGPVKSYAFPNQARTYYQNSGFLSDFEIEYEKLFDRIYHLGPLRESPKRQYGWTGSKPKDVGQSGEKIIDAILAKKMQGEKQNIKHKGRRYEFEALIAYWLKRLGLIYDFKIEEIAEGSNLYKTKVKKAKGSPETSIMDVGFGVSQILPVLVLLYYVPKNSIVLLE